MISGSAIIGAVGHYLGNPAVNLIEQKPHLRRIVDVLIREGLRNYRAVGCIGGQMQCRLILDTEEKRERARKMGVKDPRFIYGIEDMAKGDCLFAATGVTTGSLLSGVKFRKDVIETETVVMRSVTGTVRYIKAEHRQLEKFHLD